MTDGPFPDIHQHFHFHHHEAPSAELLAKVDLLAETVAEMVTELVTLRGEVTALRIGEFALANSINVLEDTMATDLSALIAEVEEQTDVTTSAITLLGSLAQQIRDLSTDPAALQALADAIDANNTRLADATVANTPGSGEPEPEPEPAPEV